MLAYFIRKFPQLSETFIANEIVELERLGIEPRIYSYKPPTEIVRHECVRLIRSPITYLPDPLYRHPLQLLRAHLALFRLEPERYRVTLGYVLRESLRKLRLGAWREFVQAGYLAVRIRQEAVEHMHAHFAHTTTQVAMLVRMLTGVTFSFTAHAHDIYLSKPADLRKKIAAANFVATCTRANGDYLRSLAGPEQGQKIQVHYHGVDLEKFALRPPPSDASQVIILSAGRLVEQKGFPDLLHACSRLKAKGKAFRCVIIGKGWHQEHLENLIKTLGLDGVVALPGARSQEELIEFYRQATIFVLPCQVQQNGKRDGIPNVLVEAMAIGVPVISTAISGIPELIADGENGLLVPERDVEALTGAMARLIDDGALRARLARNARGTVAARFDARTNIQALADMFRQLGLAPLDQFALGEIAVDEEIGL